MNVSAHHKHTPGRFLQALAIGKGDPSNALAFVQSQGHWSDREQIAAALKGVITAESTGDFGGSAFVPIANAFLGALRGFSVPLRLQNLRLTPMLTRLFVNTSGASAAEVAEGQAIPATSSGWDTKTLTPRKFAGIVAQTAELMRSTSPVAAIAIVDDLAGAVAESENRAFVAPDVVGSVLAGAPNFLGTGAAVANVDADLQHLCNLVPGVFRPGAAFVMTTETATFLSLLRGSGGCPAFEDVTPQGGLLLGLPVLITSACLLLGSPTTNIIGLLSPSEIFWADDGVVRLDVSTAAALKLDSAATAAPGNTVSMMQTDSVATRAIRESSWYARSGSGAYFIVNGF